MKFKTNKLSLKVIIASAMLATSLPALAVTGDTDQPIHIESDTQSLDMQGNVVTFTGNVVMTQGTIKINADKVVVTRPGGEQGKEIIDGYGNPATFYQMQDNGKPVKGHASHMHYELAKDLVILTGNAYLEQLDSNITGADHLSGERAKNAGLQRERQTRHNRTGSVAAAGQRQRPGPGTEEE